MCNIEKHPFEPYIPKNATKLIIGTIPPPRFSKKSLNDDDVNFYYGSNKNNFWSILGEIFNIGFNKRNNDDEIEKRKSFLKNNNIAICDIVKRTKRKKKDSANDRDLEVIEYLDILNLLKSNPNINSLIYTSQKVDEFVRDLIKYPKNNSRKFNVTINNKNYDVYILYSPSPNALRGMGKGGKEKRLEQYKQVFSN